MKNLNIGLFGFGVVGGGLYELLDKTRGLEAKVSKICVKNPNKERSLPAEYFTYEKNDILNDPEINIVVELIDDADAAFEIVKTALQNGKAVVSANKKMIAEHFEELYTLQKETGLPMLYEASTCGSIPIIRNLEEYYDNDSLQAVSGIFNGTCNYILTKMFEEERSYADVLKEAQEKGFAETDPTLDVGGFDAKFKLCISMGHAFGLFVHPDKVFNFGLQNLSVHDIRYAKEKGKKIKLISSAAKNGREVNAFVMPVFVEADNPLYGVQNEYNAVEVRAAFSDKQYFIGKGAGAHPTGSAVLSDISALRHDYQYEYKIYHQELGNEISDEKELKVYIRYNEEQALEGLKFSEVFERFESNELRYLTANIRLDQLKKISGKEGIFLSLIS